MERSIGATAEVDFKTTRPCRVEDQTKAECNAAKHWVEAVNNWGQLGKWAFHACRNPQLLDKELEYLLRESHSPPLGRSGC